MKSTRVIYLAIALCTVQVVQSHMSVSFPKPRSRPRITQTDCASAERAQKYLTWEWNEPQIPMRPCTCHGTFPDPTVAPENVLTAGSPIAVKIAGSAFHNGGHCAFWWSIDGVNFKKFLDYKDCTTRAVNNQPIDVMIPAGIDAACANRCIFGWTWIPMSSAACEIYMTCADVRIVGAVGGGTPIHTLNFNGVDSNTCVRPNPATHWSTAFGPVNTVGMTGTGGGGGGGGAVTQAPQPGVTPRPTTLVTGRPTTSTTAGGTSPVGSLCQPPSTGIYFPAWGPLNLVNGQCGSGVGSCDVGQCCSQYGYCGTTAVYCNSNMRADFRLKPCCAIVNGVYDPNVNCLQAYSALSGGGAGSMNTPSPTQPVGNGKTGSTNGGPAKSNTGMIVGIVVGVLLLIGIIVLVCVMHGRKRSAAHNKDQNLLGDYQAPSTQTVS